MEFHENSTSQRLIKSFMQLKRTLWHERAVMSHKPSEIRVLFCIKRSTRSDSGEMKVSEIGKLLQVTNPTITQLIKGLEADGLIERRADPSDRRVVFIKLTNKGELVTQKASESLVASMNGLIEYLGEEESNQLADLLGKVFMYFNEKPQWNGDEEA